MTKSSPTFARLAVSLSLLAVTFSLALYFGLPGMLHSENTVFADTVSTPTLKPTPTPSPDGNGNTILPVIKPLIMPFPREPHAQEYLDRGLGSDDVDCDGVKNEIDNCILVYNPDQKRTTSDAEGDACNAKFFKHKERDLHCDEDGDGIFDEKDNCPMISNPRQRDRNRNGIGDVCDPQLRNQGTRIISCAKPQTSCCRSKKPNLQTKTKPGS